MYVTTSVLFFRQKVNVIAGLIIFPLLSVAALISIFFSPVDHDVSWYLYAADRMLDGAKLYVDIVDLNPPLIYYLSIPSAWLARVNNWSPICLLRINVLALICISLFLCRQAIGQLIVNDTIRLSILVSLFFIMFPFATDVFGQREHITFILLLPYVFNAALRMRETKPGVGHIIIISIAAGLAFAIKPHFFIAFIAIETYLACRTNFFACAKPYPVIIVTILLSYWLTVVLYFPAYVDLIIATKPLYDFYETKPLSQLLQLPSVHICILAYIAFIVTCRTGPYKQITGVLFVFSASFFLIAFIQKREWYYHFYPALAFASLVLILIIINLLNAHSKHHWLQWFRNFCLCSVIVLLFSIKAPCIVPPLKNFIYSRKILSGWTGSLAKIIKTHANNKNILLLSTEVQPAFPLIHYCDVDWSLRFNCLWFLPGFYKQAIPGGDVLYHTPSQMSATEQFFFDAVIQDFEKYPPNMVIVHQGIEKQGFGNTKFDFIEYYLQDDRFVILWNNYLLFDIVGEYAIYNRNAP